MFCVVFDGGSLVLGARLWAGFRGMCPRLPHALVRGTPDASTTYERPLAWGQARSSVLFTKHNLPLRLFGPLKTVISHSIV